MQAITSYNTAINNYNAQVDEDPTDHIYNCHYNISIVHYECKRFISAIDEARICMKMNDMYFKVCHYFCVIIIIVDPYIGALSSCEGLWGTFWSWIEIWWWGLILCKLLVNCDYRGKISLWKFSSSHRIFSSPASAKWSGELLGSII